METFKNAEGGSHIRTKILEAPNVYHESDLEFSLLWIVVTIIAIYCVSVLVRPKFSSLFGWQTHFTGNIPATIPPHNRSNAKKELEPFQNIEEVRSALRKAGLESSQLILGIDFTKSNTWTGSRTFGGFCLHDTSRKGLENPYQTVIRIISRTLHAYDDDAEIPAFGFGDIYTQATGCFPFFPDRPCNGLEEVLDRYNSIVEGIQYSGPTNFAPVIKQAVEIVKTTGQFHILVIIADGQVDKAKETSDAIVFASNYPLSIVCVGVGDGPWEKMEEFDDSIPHRRFDNFQFVDFSSLQQSFKHRSTEEFEAAFACSALMEIPEQFGAMRKLGIL